MQQQEESRTTPDRAQDKFLYSRNFRHAGYALILLGLADIALMIRALMQGNSYSSGLNIFALIAGLLLIRGSTRTASVVSFLAAAYAVVAAIAFSYSLICTTGMILAEWRLISDLQGIFSLVSFLGVLWVLYKLNNRETRDAQIRENVPAPSLRGPVLLGLAISIMVIVMTNYGPGVRHAKELAQAQLGPGYNYSITSLSIKSKDGVTTGTAQVKAWNKNETKTVDVKWQSESN